VKVKLFLCGGEEPVSDYPLGLGYLKSNCVDADIEIVNDRAELKDCDLIGLSSTAGGLKEAIEILESVNIPVAIGGQGTMWEGLKKYPFEHIVIGEGERAFQRIIDGATDNRIVQEDNISDLDTLCFPDRGRCAEQVPILTSRGCPWNCYFCSSQNYWGKPRWHSAEYFLDEVDFVTRKYPQSHILYIMDDLFIVNLPRFNEIYRLWMGKKLNKRFELKGFVRSNRMTMDIAKKMKAMGFLSVRFGAESGSNRMLKIINKQETVEDHQRCVDICNKIGLNVCCSLIQYLPGETVEDRRLTGEFRMKNQRWLCVSGNYRFQPFPGTHFYNGQNPLEGDWRTRGKLNPEYSEEGTRK
jgi:magnesium-protoporphyrin IX monomethyl ester (oxidative) cyclase